MATNHTHPAPTIERRELQLETARPRVETRDDKPAVITGYAAVFYRKGEPGTEYELWRDAYERIMPGAFDAALRDGDVVRGLTNHDSNWLLGRSDLGTVRLSIDKIGLRYEIDPPDTQAGRDTVALLERGDLDASSFGFRVYGGKRGAVAWIDEVRDGKDIEIREIREVELLDVGPVTFAAYSAATAGVRSGEIPEHLAEARASYDRHRAAQVPDYLLDEIEMQTAIAGVQLLAE
jgi:HK97 family phage prohead protease